ncbi:hypothetical protein [Haliea sp.]|uniref:hypothetical protein n=1 Tax=Haliea sp. TaxID=1932666 RepID=UPI003527B931
MGIWDSIKQSAKEANEGAHASRLKRDLELTLRQFDSLGADRKAECADIFLLRVTDLMAMQGNWSRDGALKSSKEMFKDARERHDFDRSRSYAIALSGLWLESQYRDHEDAKKVFHDLSTLYERLVKIALNRNPEAPAKRLESHQPAAKKNSTASVKKIALSDKYSERELVDGRKDRNEYYFSGRERIAKQESAIANRKPANEKPIEMLDPLSAFMLECVFRPIVNTHSGST